MKDRNSIKEWMQKHLSEHIESNCNDIDYVSLVEAWDKNQGTGSETTFDMSHIAWDIAIDIQWERADAFMRFFQSLPRNSL